DGLVRRLGLVGDAAVDLARRRVADVVVARGAQVAGAEGPRRDRLRLERLGVPGGRHLAGDDAADVLLHAQHVDGVARRGGGLGRAQLAAVLARAAVRQHQLHLLRTLELTVGGERAVDVPGRAGLVVQRVLLLVALRRVDRPVGHLATAHLGGQVDRLVVAQRAQLEAGGVLDLDRVGGVGADQHPDLPALGRQRGAGVVLLQDRVVLRARPRAALGAVLAHADAVAVAVALEGDLAAGRRDRVRRLLHRSARRLRDRGVLLPALRPCLGDR